MRNTTRLKKEFLVICSPLQWGGGVLTMIKSFHGILLGLGYKPVLIYPEFTPKESFIGEVKRLSKLFSVEYKQFDSMQVIEIPQLPFVDWNERTSLQYYWFGLRIKSLIKKAVLVSTISGTAQIAIQLAKSKVNYLIWIGSSHAEEIKAKIESPLGDEAAEKLVKSKEWQRLLLQEKVGLVGANKVIALSDYHKNHILQLSPQLKEKIVSLQMPIDIIVFNRSKRNINRSHSKVIMYAGRINDPRKNINLLINSFSLLSKKNSNFKFKLWLVGEKPRVELIELVKRLGISDNVKFMDSLDKTKLAQKYRKADVFVSTSIQEPLGLSVIEALSCGTPVITTASGGPDETVHKSKGGIVVKNDPESISAAILNLFNNDKEWMRLSLNGSDYVQKNLNINTITEKVKNILARVYNE